MARASCCIALVLLIAAVAESAIYLGCFVETQTRDQSSRRGSHRTSRSNNTHELCINDCDEQGFDYAGVQWGRECICSNNRPSYDDLASSESECNMPCTGNPRQVCGSQMRIGIFSLRDARPGSAALNYIGCHAPNALTRLQGLDPSTVSQRSCQVACERNQYLFYGLSEGSNCYCGNHVQSELVNEEECRSPCEGNRYDICGGADQQMSVYRSNVPEPTTTRAPQTIRTTTHRPRPTTLPTFPSKRPSKKGSSSSSSSSSSSGSSSSSSEERKGSGKGKHSSKNTVAVASQLLGCYDDPKNKFTDYTVDLKRSNTQDNCARFCSQGNYRFAGLQDSLCLCGKKSPDKKDLRSQSECNTRCSGDNNQRCGGRARITVIQIRN